MPSKAFRVVSIVVVVVFLLASTFSAGFITGGFLPWRSLASGTTQSGNPSPLAKGTPSPGGTGATNLTQLFAPFWETWNLVHAQYVDQPVNDVALMRGAISGMLAALGDKHTSYMAPDLYQTVNQQLAGNFEGIGATVDTTGKSLKVVSPIPGSPAEKAGLKPGDLIIAVDGKDVTGMDGSLVLEMVRGPAGSIVHLTVQREGEAKAIQFDITRAKITVPSVIGKMLANKIAYVRITDYGEKTNSELTTTLNDLMPQKPVGLILDLRYNGGGYLDTAIDVLSQFVKSGTVVMYEQFGDGTRKTYKTKSGGLATDIPLVVLVNEGSASASEITAGAIQDLGRGKLVGVTTYGKGTVQTWVPLQSDGGAVRVTIARWYTPNNRQISDKGLTPDVEVKITQDDINANLDPQLDKAVQLLTPGL